MKIEFPLVATTLLAMAIAGCSESAVEQAERHLKRIEQMGSKEEICQAKREVAKAYLDEGSQLDYDSAKVDADSACLSAVLERM